jgi:hypothetical protein
MAAGVFDAIAGFIGELTKVDFPSVGGKPQHEDIGARTKDAVFQTGDDNAFDLWVLEANPLQCVVQFNVYAQVVGVEFEFVSRSNASVFVDIELQGGNFAFVFDRPVLVLAGVDFVIHCCGVVHVCLLV